MLMSDGSSDVCSSDLSDLLNLQLTPQRAVASALKRLEGIFAVVFVFAGRHDLMIGARRGSPLAVGIGDGEMYLGSDALALAHLPHRIVYLEEGDWVEVTAEGCSIHDPDDHPVQRNGRTTAAS